MEYKVGDRILVAAKIAAFDPGAENIKYAMEFITLSGTFTLWLDRGVIAALINRPEPQTEKPEAPTIPEGWTPASVPPSSSRDVRILLNSGKERKGWHGEYTSDWFNYGKRNTFYNKCLKVLAWKDL
jgi:hypothetical protein